MPGLFATIAFNVDDRHVHDGAGRRRGVIDRFRSMPIARVAVPFGQTAATAVYGVLLPAADGRLRAAGGLADPDRVAPALGALRLLWLFQFAATWVGMYLGLLIGKEEAAGAAVGARPAVAMLSNVFVPTAGMPAWLRTSPTGTRSARSARPSASCCGNPTAPTNGAWPLEHPVVASLGWTALLLLVFVPLCTARYARPRA